MNVSFINRGEDWIKLGNLFKENKIDKNHYWPNCDLKQSACVLAQNLTNCNLSFMAIHE